MDDMISSHLQENDECFVILEGRFKHGRLTLEREYGIIRLRSKDQQAKANWGRQILEEGHFCKIECGFQSGEGRKDWEKI